MKQFKILMIYLVNADNRKMAIELFEEATKGHVESKYFEVQLVKEVESPGWIAGISKQLFGK